MLLENLKAPVTLFDCAQFGIDLQSVQDKLRTAYPEYGWDGYLLQQNKIALIRAALSPQKREAVPEQVWDDLYHGRIADADISSFLPSLPAATLAQVAALEPTRKRAISEYRARWRGRWHIERVPSRPIALRRPLVANHGHTDFRVMERRFRELPERLFDDSLRTLLIGFVRKVAEAAPSVTTMNVVVHHTVIYCHPGQDATNSPEGIHQDGKDFIVSALVVERSNIRGGKSVIYGADRATRLFECELRDGQGIFQPDAGTDLWHEVTPIAAVDEGRRAFRSTIGLDLSLDG